MVRPRTLLRAWTDYVTIDGQIVAQRNVQYPLASAWKMQNWGSFNWGTPSGNLWGGFNWGAASWSGNVVSWGYFNLDHLGSVAVITDQGENVIQRLSFDAFGKQRNPNGSAASCGTITAPTTRGFTNQEEMPTQCLVNLNARLYDASIGKFMAPDSVVPDTYNGQSYNRYTYVNNNPLSFTDPTGHQDTELVTVTGQRIEPAGTLPGSVEQDSGPLRSSEPTPPLSPLPIGSHPYDDLTNIGSVDIGGPTPAAPGANNNSNQGDLIKKNWNTDAGGCSASVIAFLNCNGHSHERSETEESSDGSNTDANRKTSNTNNGPIRVAAAWPSNGGPPLEDEEAAALCAENPIACAVLGAASAILSSDTPQPHPLYRGGNSFEARPQDVRIDKSAGLVLPTRGISLSTDEASMVQRFGSAKQIETIPDKLHVIQTSATHFEIAPRAPMTMQEYQSLLSQIKVK